MIYHNNRFKLVNERLARIYSTKFDYTTDDPKEKWQWAARLLKFPLTLIKEFPKYNHIDLTHWSQNYQIEDVPFAFGMNDVQITPGINYDSKFKQLNGKMQVNKSPNSDKPIMNELLCVVPPIVFMESSTPDTGIEQPRDPYDYPNKITEAAKESSEFRFGNFYNLLIQLRGGTFIFPFLLPKGMDYEQASFYLFAHLPSYCYYKNSKLYVDKDLLFEIAYVKDIP